VVGILTLALYTFNLCVLDTHFSIALYIVEIDKHFFLVLGWYFGPKDLAYHHWLLKGLSILPKTLWSHLGDDSRIVVGILTLASYTFNLCVLDTHFSIALYIVEIDKHFFLVLGWYSGPKDLAYHYWLLKGLSILPKTLWNHLGDDSRIVVGILTLASYTFNLCVLDTHFSIALYIVEIDKHFFFGPWLIFWTKGFGLPKGLLFIGLGCPPMCL
jgi:hypothetical protein